MHPVVGYTSAILSTRAGWLLFGTAGYLAYRAGKYAAQKSDNAVERPGLVDRTVKGAMKTAYKAQMKLGASFAKTHAKYTAMWNEVQAEIHQD